MPNFDTHKFVKSFVAAKTDEEKAEAIVDAVIRVKSDNEGKIVSTFDEVKKDFATKSDLLSTKNDLRSEIKALEIRLTNKIYLTSGGLAIFISGLILGVLPIIIK